MQYWLKFALLQAIALCFVANAGTEPLPDPAVTPVYSRFINLTHPNKSLPVPTTMARDQQGFLWLGTQQGLFRHDGTEVLEFRADPGRPGALSASWVSALAPAPDGGLWVGTRYGGLNYYDPATERFTRYELTASFSAAAEISSLLFDANQTLWVATYGGGLFRWQPQQQQFSPITLPDLPNLAVSHINDIYQDPQGGLWLAFGDAPLRTIGQQQGGVLYQAADSSSWQQINFEQTAGAVSVTRIRTAADGKIYAASYGQGLYHYQAAQQRFVKVPQPAALQQALLSDLSVDAEGGLWLSNYSADSRGGLWHYNAADGWQHYPYSAEFSDGLPRSDLLGLYYDQQGILWTISQSGFKGLSRFAKQIKTLPPGQLAHGLLPAPNVLGLDAVAADSLWLANREGGVLHFNPLTGELQHWPIPVTATQVSSVQTVKQDRAGILWLGTDKGLFQLDPATRNWQLFSLTAGDEPIVRFLFIDRQQNLWVGSRGQGVFRLDPQRSVVRHFRQTKDGAPGVRFEDVNNISEDYLGAIWIGSTDQGLARYQPATGQVDYWMQYPGSSHGLRLNGIQLIMEDTQQQLWVRAGNVNHRVLRDSAQPDIIQGFKAYLMPEDQDPELQQADIFRLLYRLHWLPEQNSYLELDEKHGMQSVTWIGSWDLYGKRIYRGGARGFDYFDVDKLPQRVALSQVQLTGLSLFNQPVSAGSALLPKALSQLQQLRLNYEQDMFSLRFASPEFKQPRLIQYRYQLVGFDRDWILTSAQNAVATYTRLPPGNYVFQVSARLADGQWQQPTQLALQVLPPWWLTWWFRLGLLLSVALGIGWFIHWKLQREYRVRHKLEQQVAQRTAQLAEQNQALELSYQRLQQTQQQLITQEKMASLGGLVAGVAHEINTPLGICVTATSHLQSEQQQLAAAFASRTMQQSQFERFMQQLADGLKILQVNTQRAADLVSSFKQVSVDQSTDSYREFELYQYLQDVMLSLRSRLKQQHCQLQLQCPNPLPLYSDPGALAQVLTNLVINALIHGLDGQTAAEIRIEVTADDDWIQLNFGDNGRGMTSEQLRQLFDPFFTTKRNQGGSGLGAHIVYNLVTVRLQGSINVQSAPGQGLHYQIRFPRWIAA